MQASITNLNDFNFNSIMMKNNFFSNWIANDYSITMENKENYSLTDSSKSNNDALLSRSSSTCSLLDLNNTPSLLSNSSNTATSPSLTTSPSSTHSSNSFTFSAKAIAATATINAYNNNNTCIPTMLQPQSKSDDIDWNILQNAEKFLLRDDTVWINKLNKDLWWNINMLTEMVIMDNKIRMAQNANNNNINTNPRMPRKICGGTSNFYQPQPQQKQYFNGNQQNTKFINKPNGYQHSYGNNNSRIFGRIITNSHGFPQQA